MIEPYYIENTVSGKIFISRSQEYVYPPKEDSEGVILLSEIEENGENQAFIEADLQYYTGIDELSASILIAVREKFGSASKEYAFLYERLVKIISSDIVSFAHHHWGPNSVETKWLEKHL